MSDGFEDNYINEIPEEEYEDLFTFDVDMGVIECEFNLYHYFFTVFTLFLEDHNPQADAKRIRQWAGVLSIKASDHFSRSLSAKMNEAISELFTESLYQAVRASGLEKNIPTSMSDVLKVRKNGERSIKERLEVKRGGSEADFDLSKLSVKYKEVYPIWRDAKGLYRQNKARSNWRAIIKAAHPELPDDLIHTLALRGASKSDRMRMGHSSSSL